MFPREQPEQAKLGALSSLKKPHWQCIGHFAKKFIFQSFLCATDSLTAVMALCFSAGFDYK